jgi:hypothetical protein
LNFLQIIKPKVNTEKFRDLSKLDPMPYLTVDLATIHVLHGVLCISRAEVFDIRKACK